MRRREKEEEEPDGKENEEGLFRTIGERTGGKIEKGKAGTKKKREKEKKSPR